MSTNKNTTNKNTLSDPQIGLESIVGRTMVRRDEMRADRMAALAATLDRDAPDDGRVPPLWHWVLFQAWSKWSELGPDGHADKSDFIPEVPGMERRMWAGSAVTFNRLLRLDEAVERRSVIEAATLKQGRTGKLAFVRLRHDIGPAGETAISEVQDVVFRAADDPAVIPAAAEPVPAAARTRQVVPDPLTLFRYSAVTGNSHRIHYDYEYVTQVEHYPGLVVQGALQATWLADFARDCLAGAPIRHFDFRARRAAFHGAPLTLTALATEDGLAMTLRDATGATCMVGRVS